MLSYCWTGFLKQAIQLLLMLRCSMFAPTLLSSHYDFWNTIVDHCVFDRKDETAASACVLLCVYWNWCSWNYPDNNVCVCYNVCLFQTIRTHTYKYSLGPTPAKHVVVFSNEKRSLGVYCHLFITCICYHTHCRLVHCYQKLLKYVQNIVLQIQTHISYRPAIEELLCVVCMCV